MNGFPASSTSALGIFSVTGRSRVAKPPARIAAGTFSICNLRFAICNFATLLDDDLGSLEVEPEADFLQTALVHGMAELGLVGGVEHQESPAARADQLSAQGAV